MISQTLKITFLVPEIHSFGLINQFVAYRTNLSEHARNQGMNFRLLLKSQEVVDPFFKLFILMNYIQKVVSSSPVSLIVMHNQFIEVAELLVTHQTHNRSIIEVSGIMFRC